MKFILGTIFLAFIAYQPAIGREIKHDCLPGGYGGICILGHVFYNRTHNDKHIFPQNKTHIRIGNDGWSKGIDSVITEFDAKLYAELGSPKVVEILNAEMELLEIPQILSHGNFAENKLDSFWNEKGAEPMLSYLDLGANSISNLTNITVFVNLETLYLYYNHIAFVELNVFRNMTKLKFLSLNYNRITELSGDYFPPTLSYLGLYNNDLKTLNYSALRIPSLEILNIQRNYLTKIDASKLLLGLPNLKMLRLHHNEFSHEELRAAMEVLDQRNVSYRNEAEVVACYYEMEEIEGVCLQRQYLGQGWGKAVILSIVTVAIAIVFVLLVRWVFIAMNK